MRAFYHWDIQYRSEGREAYNRLAFHGSAVPLIPFQFYSLLICVLAGADRRPIMLTNTYDIRTYMCPVALAAGGTIRQHKIKVCSHMCSSGTLCSD